MYQEVIQLSFVSNNQVSKLSIIESYQRCKWIVKYKQITLIKNDRLRDLVKKNDGRKKLLV